MLRLVRELAAEGKSIIFISSELAELMAVSDRIAVLSAGALVETVETSSLSAVGGAAELKAEQKLQMIVQRGGANG